MNLPTCQNLFVTLKINTCSALVVIYGHVHSSEKSETLAVHLVPAKYQGSCYLVRIIWRGPNMLMDILGRTRFQGPLAWTKCLMDTFCPFCWLFHLFKMAPKCGAQVLSSIPKCKKGVTCLMEKNMRGMSSIQAGVTALVTLCSILINQQYILHKVSLNRNPQKTTFVDQVTKML